MYMRMYNLGCIATCTKLVDRLSVMPDNKESPQGTKQLITKCTDIEKAMDNIAGKNMNSWPMFAYMDKEVLLQC